MQIIIPDEEHMLRLGNYLARIIQKGDVIYLTGELGAGKTTLVRGIARGLGYNGRVTSPTFTLMNVYDTVPPICHFDFYRLEDGDLFDLGLEDYVEKDVIVLIEWPQAGRNVLPEEALMVDINLVDDDYDRERQVLISARGNRYTEKLEELTHIVDFGS